jgi:hypothetical protein
MSAGQEALTLLALGGNLAVWWLAVRAVFGRRFGILEWVPIALLAFGVPLLLADVAALSRHWSDDWLIAGWLSVALVIDMVWLLRRWVGRSLPEAGKW